MNKIERKTMTIPEFAELFGFSKNLAYFLARKNELPVPVIFVGERRMVVSRAAVLRLLENGQGAQPKEKPGEIAS